MNNLAIDPVVNRFISNNSSHYIKILIEIFEKNQKANDEQIQDQYINKILNGRYKVLSNIGVGSYGLVYLVEDTKMEANR